VRDAMIFLRSTPLVTRNAQDQRTGQDGWLQLTVTPERDFPELRPPTRCSSSSRRPARAIPNSPASPAIGSFRSRSADRRRPGRTSGWPPRAATRSPSVRATGSSRRPARRRGRRGRSRRPPSPASAREAARGHGARRRGTCRG
jgi:hypothetical protein